jgi:hypothetical protein
MSMNCRLFMGDGIQVCTQTRARHRVSDGRLDRGTCNNMASASRRGEQLHARCHGAVTTARSRNSVWWGFIHRLDRRVSFVCAETLRVTHV